MDLSTLTLQQLRCVVAVERHRSFREAARACHVSQPALSASIKKVEDALGLLLFDRTRQPIVTTDRGALVVGHARLVLEQIERLSTIAEAKTAPLTGTYRVGVLPSLASTVLPLLLPPFTRRCPNVDLQITEARTDELVRLLRNGSIDGALAVTPLGVPGLVERKIFLEPFVVYLPPGHPLTLTQAIPQSELVEEHVWLLRDGHCFRQQVLHLCDVDRPRPHGAPRIAFDSDSFDTLVRLVDAGVGVTLLPELFANGLPTERRSGQVRRLAKPEPVREVSFVSGREHARRDVGDALMAALENALPDSLRRAKGRRVDPRSNPR